MSALRLSVVCLVLRWISLLIKKKLKCSSKFKKKFKLLRVHGGFLGIGRR